MSSANTITASATSQSASTTINLFPTTTTNSAYGNGLNQGSPTTYYFVFLGVLVVLLIIAASLAYRALRIRRQFRSATQIALARGEPPPRLQDDYWALGVLSPWRMNEDGTRRERDWNGTGGGRDGFDADGGFTSRRGGVKTKWERKPVLWEWEVRDEVGGDGRGEVEKEGFDHDMPVSLQSLDPPDAPSSSAPDPNPIPPSNRESILTSWRRDRDRSRSSNPSGSGHIPIHGHDRNTALSSISAPLTHPHTYSSRSRRTRELDREIRIGEEMRAAVIIQMPFQEDAAMRDGERERDRGDGDSDSDSMWDERPGWRVGMELGVWEGNVGPQGKGL